jgi:hypothetical protein
VRVDDVEVALSERVDGFEAGGADEEREVDVRERGEEGQ